MVKSLLGEEMMVLDDDTEINKKYGKKFEDSDYIKDGSTGVQTTVKGYMVTEMVALSKRYEQSIAIIQKYFQLKVLFSNHEKKYWKK